MPRKAEAKAIASPPARGRRGIVKCNISSSQQLLTLVQGLGHARVGMVVPSQYESGQACGGIKAQLAESRQSILFQKDNHSVIKDLVASFLGGEKKPKKPHKQPEKSIALCDIYTTGVFREAEKQTLTCTENGSLPVGSLGPSFTILHPK